MDLSCKKSVVVVNKNVCVCDVYVHSYSQEFRVQLHLSLLFFRLARSLSLARFRLDRSRPR